MKKLNGKLALNRETLRALTPSEITGVAGGVTYGINCTSGSNTNATCETCFGPSCKQSC